MFKLSLQSVQLQTAQNDRNVATPIKTTSRSTVSQTQPLSTARSTNLPTQQSFAEQYTHTFKKHGSEQLDKPFFIADTTTKKRVYLKSSRLSIGITSELVKHLQTNSESNTERTLIKQNISTNTASRISQTTTADNKSYFFKTSAKMPQLKSQKSLKSLNLTTQRNSEEQTKTVLIKQIPESAPQHRLSVTADAPTELLKHQKDIQSKTERKGLVVEINELVKLQENMLNRKQDVVILKDSKAQRRQAIYKSIYENVKKISGDQHDQEEQKRRDKHIMDFIQKVESPKETDNKPRAFSGAKAKGRLRKVQKAKPQQLHIPEEIKIIPLASPKQSTPVPSPKPNKNIVLASTQFESKMTSRVIREVNSSSEESPSKGRPRRKSSIDSITSGSSISSTGNIRRRNALKQKATTNFTSAVGNVFEKQQERRASQFYRKGSIVTIGFSKIRRNSSFAHFESETEQMMENRKSVLYHKQIDKELLHILITRWRTMYQSDFGTTGKPLHLQFGIRTEDALRKRQRNKRLAIALLKWMKRMIRCKVTLAMLQHQGVTIFPTQPYQQDGSYSLFRYVKYANRGQVEGLLRINQKLIWEFNELGQNVLHIAAKRNHFQLIRYLADMGADYEKKDDMQRTPLYYAVANEHKESFVELLTLGAEPWDITTKSEYFSKILLKLRKIHLILLITPVSVRELVFQHELRKVLA